MRHHPRAGLVIEIIADPIGGVAASVVLLLGTYRVPEPDLQF